MREYSIERMFRDAKTIQNLIETNLVGRPGSAKPFRHCREIVPVSVTRVRNVPDIIASGRRCGGSRQNLRGKRDDHRFSYSLFA